MYTYVPPLFLFKKIYDLALDTWTDRTAHFASTLHSDNRIGTAYTLPGAAQGLFLISDRTEHKLFLFDGGTERAEEITGVTFPKELAYGLKIWKRV